MFYPRKGQLGIFIVIGVISVVVGIFLLNTNSIFKDTTSVSSSSVKVQFENSKIYFDSCSETLLEKGIQLVSIQGGYFDVETDSATYSEFKIPYLWDGEKSSILEKEEVEEQVETFIANYFDKCILGFRENGVISLTHPDVEPDVDVTIDKFSVDMEISFPLKFSFDEYDASYSKIKVDYPIDFQRKLEIANEIVELHFDSPYFIPVSDLNRLAFQEGFQYSLAEMGNNEVMFQVAFDDSRELADLDMFSFMVRYKNFEG